LLMLACGILVAVGAIALLIFGSEGEPLIGGERDMHGCLGAAGYSWERAVGACIKDWELDDDQMRAAEIAVDFVGEDELTVLGVVTAGCSGCFLVGLVTLEQVALQVALENWEVEMDSFLDCINVGYPVIESYPRQCSNGSHTWTEQLGSKSCEVGSDCVVFGEDGDCNCGCYNRYDFPPGSGGDCFCAAPEFCECVDDVCFGV